MADFRIIFAGLMCHVRVDDYTRTAAIVRDGNHQPRIWVRTGDLAASPAPTFQETTSPDPNWVVFKIPLDARIKIGGLDRTKLDNPPSPAVPSVKEFIPRFDVLEEVLATQRHPLVAGYIVYGGNKVEVNCYYADAARFKKDDAYQCRARELLVTAVSSVSTVEITDVINNRSMTVSGSGTIAFTQLDKDDTAGDHKLFRHLSKGVVGVLPMDVEKGTCPGGGCVLPAIVFTSVTVECTSSQWP